MTTNSFPTTPSSSSPPTTIVGIDLGTLTTKITLSSTHDYEIVRNAHGGHTTPTSITFDGINRPRLLGEDSVDVSRGDENTVWMMDRLLAQLSSDDGIGSMNNDGRNNEGNGGGEGGGEKIEDFARFQYNPQTNSVYIPNMDESYDTTSLLAMLLGRVKRNVLSTIQRRTGNTTTTVEKELEFVFAIPSNYSQSTQQAIMDAAYAASIKKSRCVESTQCLAAVYQRKFYEVKSNDNEEGGETKKKIVMIVEMGHARSCVSILQCGVVASESSGGAAGAGEELISSTTEEKKEHDNNNNDDNNNEQVSQGKKDTSKVQVLSTVSSATLGASLIDIALYHHFQSNHPSLSHNTTLSPKSRPAQRLMEGCQKLKHLLSMLPEGTVTVETIGKNDMDVTLSGNRELLTQLCHTTVVRKLQNMIELAVDKAGGMNILGDVDAVEITGGGTRIPMIQDAIRHVIGKKNNNEDFVLSKSLDDTSLAFGASLISPVDDDDDTATTTNNNVENITPEREERRAQLLEKELSLMNRDIQMVKKDEIRNQIEAHILELRSARHSTHGSLLPSSEEFASYLDDNDDWLFSEECEHATVEAMEERWTQIQGRTQELCADYLAATQADAERKERELEEEVKRAAAEQDAEAAAANGGDGEVEDHDTRRLPFKRRMEIVLKNKAEANELFSGGNYQHAAARYAKALSHCTKFFDLSPEQQKEVNDVKLSLYLNLAFAYIKLEKLDNAFLQCNEALNIDATSVKALYRRATVLYQKRKFDEASKDLDAAEKIAPEDKAVKKLRLLVEKQLMKQQAKEKAMAKKMFG
jgi:molecular chaperone DnaK (HSP70)/tetratricopeptide (TPR) repeat protein